MTPLDPLAIPLQGASLIEASAGTGKTTTITLLVLRLLLEEGLEVHEILVVTYTRAATAELRDRVRRALARTLRALDGAPVGDRTLEPFVERRRRAGMLERDRARLALALRDFDRAAIFTIHGFCQRTLFERAFESSTPFEMELVGDVAPMIAEVVHDYWALTAYEASPAFAVRLLAEKSGAHPVDLARLAARAVRHPRMPVLPDAVALRPPDETRVERTLEAAASLWREHRGQILAALCREGCLKRTSYAPERILERWAPALDAFAEPGRSFAPVCVWELTPAALAEGVRAGQTPPKHAFFDACAEIVAAHAALELPLTAAVLGVRHDIIGYARAELERRKRELRAQSFDDLLHALDDALAGPGGGALAAQIARGTKAALIDEFQDTDPVQYSIFRRLHDATGVPLVLIGDPKQAIYGFRGADVFAYVAASRRAAKARYSLDTNHRSDPSLVGAVNALFANVDRPFVFPEIDFTKVDPAPDAVERLRGTGVPEAALTILFAPRAAFEGGSRPIASGTGGKRIPACIAAEIARLLDADVRVAGEPIRPRHVAVLCRTNAQARAVQRELRPLGVPSVLEGDSSVFDAPMAAELAAVLAALAQPSDVRRVRAALVTSLFGVGGAELYRMQEAEGALEAFLESFARWSRIWHELGFVQGVHALLDEAGVHARLLSWSDGERRLTDVLHLVELLHGAASRQHLGPLALLRWYTQMRVDPRARALIEGEAAQIRLEHDEHAVRLTTIHKSKGLEYPIVFCPFLWGDPIDDGEVLFHDRQDDDRLKLDLGSDAYAEHHEAARAEAIAESSRLCYVALTRARHRCFVVWGRFAKGGGSPLARLLHAPRDVAPDSITEATLEARLDGLSDEAMRAEISDLCARSVGAIGLRDLDLGPGQPYRSREPFPQAVAARKATRRIARLPRMSSFTELVRSADTGSDAVSEAQLGLDRDEEGATLLSAPDAAPSSAAERVVLADFPAGTKAGLLIHAIFEHVDFRRADPDELGREVRDRLGRFGFDVERWAEPLEQALASVLATPLDASGVRLADIERADRVDELEFMLPVARAGRALDPVRLARVLARHEAPAACPGYHARVAALGFPALRGHLKGFVDLVFRHGGRYYLIDYKSNRLGASVDDYRAERLAAPMSEHHYPLQYLIYTTALHSYLALRLPGYDYEAHMGGVYYLFVRGMAPAHELGTGVYRDRPSRELVEELATLLRGSERSP